MSKKIYVEEYKLECRYRPSKNDENVLYYYTTKDMIKDHIEYWEAYAGEYKDKEIKMLEIGSFQGQSATWWLENILTHPKSRLVCVDPFFERKRVPDFKIFCDNIEKTGKMDQTIIIRGLSGDVLPALLNKKCEYDIIYVDGSHEYDQVFEDCINSWLLLKPNGLLILDDYLMNPRFANDKKGPKPAIDKFIEFLNDNEENYDILDTSYKNGIKRRKSILGYQVQILKY